MELLLIEDDPQICEVIRHYFTARGAAVETVQDGAAALDLVYTGLKGYDLVLLDIMLPGADGFTICREIRRRTDIPLVFITARGREEDILSGYDLGCDDYVVKPFLLSALYAKCEALLRRAGGTICDDRLVCGAVTIDTRRLICTVDGTELDLPPKQFAILLYLMRHPGWTVSRETLLDRVWGMDYFGSDRVVDTHIKKLRRALGPAGAQIRTLVGRGYRMTEG